LELRHLRYFIAIAEEGSFTRAGTLLRVAQPALSRQIRQLEAEVGVPLLARSPRGVKLTTAGEAFLVEARRALEHASLAAESARSASAGVGPSLRFAHGNLYGFTRSIEELLASFRAAHPEVRVEVRSQPDPVTHDELISKTIDAGCAYLTEVPPVGFGAHGLVEFVIKGVLLPASHALAAQEQVSLAELRGLPLVTMEPERWPGFHRMLEAELQARGLQPRISNAGTQATPIINIAAGAGWGLATEEVGAPYRGSSNAVVYRPFVDPPISVWLALVWAPPAGPMVERLLEAAHRVGLAPSTGTRRKATPRRA
jgi:DNA-binding transcriptional LysR family regulator